MGIIIIRTLLRINTVLITNVITHILEANSMLFDMLRISFDNYDIDIAPSRVQRTSSVPVMNGYCLSFTQNITPFHIIIVF